MTNHISAAQIRRTLYFSSDRVIQVHLRRTHEQALKDFERMETWENSNTKVGFIPPGSLQA